MGYSPTGLTLSAPVVSPVPDAVSAVLSSDEAPPQPASRLAASRAAMAKDASCFSFIVFLLFAVKLSYLYGAKGPGLIP